MIVLQILGLIFLLVLLVVGYFAWRFYRVVKRASDSDYSKALEVLPSLEFELQASDIGRWQNPKRLRADEAVLKKLGAAHAGYYFTTHASSNICISLWNFKQRIVVAIYEASPSTNDDHEEDKAVNAADVKYVSEAMLRLANGGSICVSNNETADLLPRPKKHALQKTQEIKIPNLLKTLKSHVPEGVKIAPIRDAREDFIDSYFETTEWVWKEAQIRSEKMQEVFNSIGANVSDDDIENLVSCGQHLAVENASRVMIREFSRRSKLSAAKWESIRDRLVVVNEKMLATDVAAALYEFVEDPSDEHAAILESFEEKTEAIDPIKSFHALAAKLGIQPRRLAAFKSPYVSEIYLRN